MIFNYTTYRKYLETKVGKKGARTGKRKRLAEAIGVHTTYVSQVLIGKLDFSMEQAELINQFLEHTEEEGEYFIYLVLKERAGNQALKKRLQKKIQVMRDQRLNISKRISPQDSIQQEDRIKFYSSHHYGAIHVLVSIKEFQTVESLAQALQLPRNQVQEMVEFLLRLGVVVEKDDRLQPGPNHIHVGKDSELVLSHHKNWRIHTLSHLRAQQESDLHYSACVSLSQNDAFKIKEVILENLQSNIQTISQSPEETAYVYSLDFYSLL